MSCGVGRRHSSDPALLWLWCRPAAVAPIQPLAWELPYAAAVALKKCSRASRLHDGLSLLEHVGERASLSHRCAPWMDPLVITRAWNACQRFRSPGRYTRESQLLCRLAESPHSCCTHPALKCKSNLPISWCDKEGDSEHRQLWMECAFQKCGALWAAVVLRSQGATGWLLKEVSCTSALSAESGQSSGQFQGRPSEVWSQWQSQHHGQQSGEQHSHQQPGQTEVFQVNQRAPPSRRYRRLLSASFPPRSLPQHQLLIAIVSSGPSWGRL